MWSNDDTAIEFLVRAEGGLQERSVQVNTSQYKNSSHAILSTGKSDYNLHVYTGICI